MNGVKGGLLWDHDRNPDTFDTIMVLRDVVWLMWVIAAIPVLIVAAMKLVPGRRTRGPY